MTVDSRSSGTGSSLPTISSASWRAVTACGSTVRTVVPRRITVISSATDEHLVELVRDEQDGEALVLELAQVGEQLVDLLRHEHGGRLVQDEDLRAAVEHLADLDALPRADAELLDQRVGIDVEAVGVGDLADLARARRAVSSTPALGRLAAEHDVLEDGQVVGQHEVLVHHADAGGDRVRRRGERHRLAVDGDRALVRLVHAVEVFISVDLPAPFSPTIACTCPRRTVMSMSWLATTPGKRLVMPCSSTATRLATGVGSDGSERLRQRWRTLLRCGCDGRDTAGPNRRPTTRPGEHGIPRSPGRGSLSGRFSGRSGATASSEP